MCCAPCPLGAPSPLFVVTCSFSEWMRSSKKAYSSREELVLRRGIFAANLAKIQQHNAEGHSWTMAVNQFADLTADEFKAKFASSLR